MKNRNDNNSNINTFHIGVLDGIRALAILIVVWYHFWQQTWIIPIKQTPFLKLLGITQINLDWLVRTGYEMVTLVIFISGFCLFLPYARNMINGDALPDTRTFYKKRIARIVPSYMLCILIAFIYNVARAEYSAQDFIYSNSPGFMLKDLFSHLTFTFNLFEDTSSSSLLNGVLWTVALEMQFYLIFPLLQKFFREKPITTYVVLNLISIVYIMYTNSLDNISFRLLHLLPSYLGVYANGFAGAMIFVGMAKSIKHEKYFAYFSTIVSIMCIYIYSLMMRALCLVDNQNAWRLNHRFSLSFLFMVFVISTAFALSAYQKIFSNRVMRFLSTISFNLYIWHQYLCLKFIQNRIPYYEGDVPPNQTGDKVWMWKLMILSIVSSFIVSTAVTYLVEKPASKLILGKKRND